jgi:hypothetical protein
VPVSGTRFETIATLDGLVREGDDELLMRKRLW